MEFYRLADAEYLLEFYTDKLIGKTLSLKSDAIITHLEITDWGNGNYRLMAKGSVTAQSPHITERDVCEITKFHKIIYTADALKERKRQ
jgi:hypothetical protein